MTIFESRGGVTDPPVTATAAPAYRKYGRDIYYSSSIVVAAHA